MSQFDQIPSSEPIQEVIKAAFDAELPLSGGWGYTKAFATVIDANPDAHPLAQLEHMIASMRAYLEMNMTQPEEARYGSINLNEKTRETIEEGERTYHHVTYEISAMKESDYADFIEEYKKGYGKEDFDMEEHFQRRKEATLVRTEPHWFEVSKVL
jgi:hypothetical protein